MNIIMHPHRSSNSGYDIMQHHHHVSIREQNDKKKFPSTLRKPYHNIMEIGENDDLILRLPFYVFILFSRSRSFFFLLQLYIFVDSTLHNCLLKKRKKHFACNTICVHKTYLLNEWRNHPDNMLCLWNAVTDKYI